MKNIALIFARGGSKGVHKKNIRIFNNKPLICTSIDLAKKSDLIDEVYVSTECSEIAEISKKNGAKIIERPKYLATDESPELESWKHAINYLNDNKIMSHKIIILPVTSPLRSLSDVNSAIRMLKIENDIIISITETNHNPYFNMVRVDKEGFYKLALKNNAAITRRQDAPMIYNMTTVIYVTNDKYIMKAKNLLEGKVGAIKIPPERGIDIDSELDFKIANLLMANSKK